MLLLWTTQSMLNDSEYLEKYIRMLQSFHTLFEVCAIISDNVVYNFVVLMNIDYKVIGREQFDLIGAVPTYFSAGTEGNHGMLPPPPTSPLQHLGRKFGIYCQIRSVTATAHLLSPKSYCSYTIQRYQSKLLRIITNAPRYVTNHTLHSDLHIP
jgi:hypothetical protein